MRFGRADFAGRFFDLKKGRLSGILYLSELDALMSELEMMIS